MSTKYFKIYIAILKMILIIIYSPNVHKNPDIKRKEKI